ncbi:MAG: DUF2214 family protein [Hyphomonadaceae bacterium]
MNPAWFDAGLSTAHFLCVLILAGALAGELFLLRLPPSGDLVRALARADLIYGIAAGLLILAGLARIYFGLKDASFYWASHAFWGKMAVFAVIGVLSIQPTRKILAWRKALKADPAFAPSEGEVRSLRRVVTIETHLLALVVVFAALMARGLG